MNPPLARCWCGHTPLEDFSADYRRCPACETLVGSAMPGEEISRVRDDEHDFYGKGYYLHHLREGHGQPDLEARARADLPERGLHWLRTLLRFVPGPGARTLELGCGHGGFVALQRWAGLDASGLELSPWLVERARAWFDVPVLAGRLEDQTLAAGTYDAVVMIDVLEHLPDPRGTLARAASLLRPPGGFLLIQTPRYPARTTYEALRTRNDPFLQQFKPVEHLHLFSEGALARLCAEVGLGEVRFEPAVFAHYDQYALASAGPLPGHSPAETLLGGPPSARAVLAMLDLADARAGLQARVAEQAAEYRELRGHFDGSEADRAARLAVIENQGAEIGRLRSEVDALQNRRSEELAHPAGGG